MDKTKNMDFIKCHSCKNIIDVSLQANIFDRDSKKTIIKKNCDYCGSMSQLVISMMYGLTSIEYINLIRKKNKQH